MGGGQQQRLKMGGTQEGTPASTMGMTPASMMGMTPPGT